MQRLRVLGEALAAPTPARLFMLPMPRLPSTTRSMRLSSTYLTMLSPTPCAQGTSTLFSIFVGGKQ